MVTGDDRDYTFVFDQSIPVIWAESLGSSDLAHHDQWGRAELVLESPAAPGPAKESETEAEEESTAEDPEAHGRGDHDASETTNTTTEGDEYLSQEELIFSEQPCDSSAECPVGTLCGDALVDGDWSESLGSYCFNEYYDCWDW